MHNWEIRPHRHSTLIQMLLIERGRAKVQMDGREFELRGPAVVWVPAFVVHGFGFAAETQGLVVTMDLGWLRELLSGSEGLWEELGHGRALALRKASAPLRTLQAASAGLRQEYGATHMWRSLMLNSAAATLAACIGRLPGLAEAASPSPGAKGRSLLHLARFREQVDRMFRQQPSLTALTEPLGVTTTQMNRLCRQHLQCSALDVLHQRLVLEAKRELGYTTLQVRQISDGLGFSDPAYFTRFFLRLTGVSPKAWREKARST